MVLKHMPVAFKTEELCRTTVQNRTASLQFVPRELMPQLCLDAVQENGFKIEYVAE